MKTEEFEQKIEKMGLEVEIDKEDFLSIKDGERHLASVNLKVEGLISTAYVSFNMLDKPKRKSLLDILWEYTNTNVAKRGEWPKYYLKWNGEIIEVINNLYLNYEERNKKFHYFFDQEKSEFTREQISSLPKPIWELYQSKYLIKELVEEQ